MKTGSELESFLREVVPILVYKQMIGGGAVKVCGAISDAFGAIARANGFDAYVVSKPGHFVNEVETSSGVYEVDLSAIQFECLGEDDVDRALETVAKNPYRAMKVHKVRSLSLHATVPSSDRPEVFWTPVASFPRWKKLAMAAMEGKYDPQFDRRELHYTGGKPYAREALWSFGTFAALLGAVVSLEIWRSRTRT